MEQTYRRQILDHLGLVAGTVDELGIGDVLDQATHQNPELRDLTVGEAVKAMVLNGLGCINHALYLVPRFFQNKPTSRLISPRVAPKQLNDDALGRALDTLYAYGVTELYSLIAATAVPRLGLAPRLVHLDSTSFHVDGRYNSDEESAARNSLGPKEFLQHIRFCGPFHVISGKTRLIERREPSTRAAVIGRGGGGSTPAGSLGFDREV
jgi:transposase